MFDFDKVTTRDAFGIAMLRVAQKNERVAAVAADTTKSMGFGPMMEEYPDRALNLGIAEQHMMTAAAGIAAEGYTVFAASYGVFTCMRALEEFRTFIAYPNLNVKVAGGMAGLSGSIEGVTHQSTEDISIMRAIPNVIVAVPADAASTIVITQELARHYGPAYIRLGRGNSRRVFEEESYTFEIGRANLLKQGTDLTIICNGSMVSRSLEAYTRLQAEGIHARVLEMPCVKPLDTEAILVAARETGAIVTAEENNKLGGLGGAVAEVLSENLPTIMRRVGLEDTFAESAEQETLMNHYGMSVEDVVSAAKSVFAAKRG